MTHTFKATALVLATAIPTLAIAQGDMTREQLAAAIGVDAEKFSLNELVQLRSDLRDENRQGVNMLLENAGSDLSYAQLQAGLSTTEVPMVEDLDTSLSLDNDGASEGKDQIAEAIGVEAEDFTLQELVDLRKAVRDENVEGIDVILKKANVDITPQSLL